VERALGDVDEVRFEDWSKEERIALRQVVTDYLYKQLNKKKLDRTLAFWVGAATIFNGFIVFLVSYLPRH
jgi:hypothetical protein